MPDMFILFFIFIYFSIGLIVYCIYRPTNRKNIFYIQEEKAAVRIGAFWIISLPFLLIRKIIWSLS